MMKNNHASSFAETRWTLVLQASSNDDAPAARAALTELCEIYYEPVVVFIRRWRHDHDEDAARSQAHAFFESILSKERSPIGQPSPSLGRFRTYLSGAVKFFLIEEIRRKNTVKRGGEVTFLNVDEQDVHSIDSTDFDRDWAMASVGKALADLEAEMGAAGKATQFEVLKPWLDGNPTLSETSAASSLSISENAVKVAIHRLRERFRAKVRKEVGSTLADPSELKAEMDHLIKSLA